VSNLKNGILWSAVGLALLIYFIVEQENEALIVGIVPAFVGIGYILVHFLDKPKKTMSKTDEIRWVAQVTLFGDKTAVSDRLKGCFKAGFCVAHLMA